jgi:hypothetical protein
MSGIVFLVLGIVTLRQGKVDFMDGRRYCFGTPARIAGIIFVSLAPLPILTWLLLIAAAVCEAAGLIPAPQGQVVWLEVAPYAVDGGVFLLGCFAIFGIAFPYSVKVRKAAPTPENEEPYKYPSGWSFYSDESKADG